jgi:hypothetical protein
MASQRAIGRFVWVVLGDRSRPAAAAGAQSTGSTGDLAGARADVRDWT